MNNTYKIVYSGSLKAGTDSEQFVHSFMRLFKAPEAQARKLVSMRRAITLKENLEQSGAEKYRQVMDKIGMQVHVEAMVTDASAINVVSPSPQPAANAQAVRNSNAVRCPKCGSERVQGDDCLTCGIIISRYRERQARLGEADASHHDNPYAAPQADVTPVHDADSDVMSGPHSVPAGNGWLWIAKGWGYFTRNPFAWIGAIVVWSIVMMVGSLIPVIGSLTINLLAPVFAAGFLLGVEEQRKGGNFEIGHLFAGFSNNVGNLVLVGLLYLVGMVMIAVITAVLFGGKLFAASGAFHTGNLEAQAAAAIFSGPLLLAVLVAMALWMPLMMAYWFAPALVALEGMSPFDAMKASFSACSKNTLPFLLYSLILLVLLIVAMIPIGLGLLALAPVMIATIYASYRDIFYAHPLSV